MRPRDIGAVIFDMDGTLVDSEPFTMRAIEAALGRRGRTGEELEARLFHGVTWLSIAASLMDRYPDLTEPITPTELQSTFERLHHDEPPALIQGSHQALIAAFALLPTAICTSSNRESLQAFLNRLELSALMAKSVCAEDCTRSKPNPQGYLLAASRLGVVPERCLVFEDSVAGVKAARAAAMQTIAITARSADALSVAQAAHGAIGDYSELPADFFAQISRPAGDR